MHFGRSAPVQRKDHWIPFRLQRLEPQIGFALGGLMLWTAMSLTAGIAAWLLALLAACVGGWAQAHPARGLGWMLLRALLLQAGGIALLTLAGLPPAGPAVLWPLAVACGYALLLPWMWGIAVALLGLAGFVAACLLAGMAHAWQASLAFTGGLAVLPLLAVSMGRVLRGAEHESESARRDHRSQLYNAEGFFANGSELFEACRKKDEPFTLVVLHAPDLREASTLLGRGPAAALFAQTVKAIEAATPAGGIAARTDLVEFAIAMPGLPLPKAQALIAQKLGAPAQVELKLGTTRARVALELLARQADAQVHTLDELYDHVARKLRSEQAGFPLSTGLGSLQDFLPADDSPRTASRPPIVMPKRRPGAAAPKVTVRD